MEISLFICICIYLLIISQKNVNTWAKVWVLKDKKTPKKAILNEDLLKITVYAR